MSWLLVTQASYYFITALWSLIHIDSFMFITGYKTDIWLVKTVGALLIPVSLTLASYIVLQTDQRPAMLLGVLSTLSFIGIDFYYYLRGVISYAYLADGVVQVAILIFWIQIIRQLKGHYKITYRHFEGSEIL
jgi:hypothetical protein